MAKARTTVSVDEGVMERAREKSINVSELIENALRRELDGPQYQFVNTNNARLEGTDGTRAYDLGVTAAFGPIKYGETLGKISAGDYVVSYVSGVGVRALGKIRAPWSGEAVDPDGPLVEPKARDNPEYHLETNWLAVLNETDAITAEEFRAISGQQVPTNTRQRLSEKYNPELIADIIRGRTF